MAHGRKTGGRKKGTPNKSTERRRRLLAAIDDDDREIIDRVIADARNGDHAARQIYFRFLRPSSRETFVRPIGYAKPKSVEQARELVLGLGECLAKGEVSVEAHDALVGGLKVYLSDKAAEQQRKLDDLEDALRGSER
jgi:hypothetical protein